MAPKAMAQGNASTGTEAFAGMARSYKSCPHTRSVANPPGDIQGALPLLVVHAAPPPRATGPRGRTACPHISLERGRRASLQGFNLDHSYARCGAGCRPPESIGMFPGGSYACCARRRGADAAGRPRSGRNAAVNTRPGCSLQREAVRVAMTSGCGHRSCEWGYARAAGRRRVESVPVPTFP